MSSTTRIVSPPQDVNQVASLAEVIFQTFAGFSLPFERTRAWLDFVGHENLRVVRDGGRVVAGLGILDFGQWFGGRSVRSAGITCVGVAPEVRGVGVGTQLMRTTVAELAQQGYPLSVLYPSTYALYRRAGYEPAGARVAYYAKPGELGVRDYNAALRPLERSDWDAARRLYDACASRRSGALDRTERQWKRVFEYGVDRVYAYAVPGQGAELDGYISYVQTNNEAAHFDIQIRDVSLRTAVAGRRILTLLGDHVTMADGIRIESGPVEPLLTLAREEYVEVKDRVLWMLRVLNVETALRDRGYPPGFAGRLELEIADELLPANCGRFALTVENGRGSVSRGGDGRIRCDVRGLAPLYSGHLPAHALRSMGLIDGADADLGLASAAFAGPAPGINDRF